MASKEKSPQIDVGERRYVRLPLKTRVIMPEDDIVAVAKEYAGGQVRPDDIVFVSEKVVAITQGRAVPTDTIRVSWLADQLWPFVRQVPYGIEPLNPGTSVRTETCKSFDAGFLKMSQRDKARR